MSDKNQQLAALLCLNIDIMSNIADKKPESALECIKDLKIIKDELLADENTLKTRYAAVCVLNSLKKEKE